MFRTAVRPWMPLLAGRKLGSAAYTAPRARVYLAKLAAGTGAAVLGYQLTPVAECGWWPFAGSGSSMGGEWDQVRKEIEELIAEKTCGPLLVRLAWHSAGTWDARLKNGGSNGATMRFHPESGHGANAGLLLARDMMEEIKAKHPSLTYADMFTFAGKVATEYMGGDVVPWKPGRSDAVNGDICTEDGRLPDAAQGANHIREVFYRMGFNDREIVALSGAHTLGECHANRSGYVGPWTRDPNGMDNSYFTLLLDEKWVLSKRNVDPPQFEDARTGELMMLPTDMALLVDPAFRKYVDLYAKDTETWQRDFAAAFGKLLENGVPR